MICFLLYLFHPYQRFLKKIYFILFIFILFVHLLHRCVDLFCFSHVFICWNLCVHCALYLTRAYIFGNEGKREKAKRRYTYLGKFMAVVVDIARLRMEKCSAPIHLLMERKDGFLKVEACNEGWENKTVIIMIMMIMMIRELGNRDVGKGRFRWKLMKRGSLKVKIGIDWKGLFVCRIVVYFFIHFFF